MRPPRSPASIRPASTTSRRKPASRIGRSAALAALLLVDGSATIVRADTTSGALAVCRTGATPMARVDLYFGAADQDPRRAAADWSIFLRTVVTPRFPDGLTSTAALGQWRSGRSVRRERSRVLTIFYRADATSDLRIEVIRSRYKARFRQASVLRVDTHACVGF